MIVYRVETPDGRGPYEMDALCGWYRSTRHPTPIVDGITFYRVASFREIRYGFARMEHVRQWFDWPEVQRMLDSRTGLVLALYEVPKKFVAHGERQVAFDRTVARRVSIQSLAPLTRMVA